MQELLSQRSIPLPEKIQEVEWSGLGAQKEEVVVRNASNLGRERIEWMHGEWAFSRCFFKYLVIIYFRT